MRSRERYFFKTIFWTILLVLFFGCGEKTKARDTNKSKIKVTNKDSIGQKKGEARLMLPDFTLQDLEGKDYRLSDYVGEKPVILVFWTTGCPFCITAIPRLNKIFLNRKDLELISINILEPKRTVRRLVEAKGIKYPVLLDPHGGTVRDYRIRGVPTVIVIDLKGSMGYYGHDLSEAMRKIEELKS